MLDETAIATVAEYKEVVGEIRKKHGLNIFSPLEWDFAILEGWDIEEYKKLYATYVRSTQIKLELRDDATELKGRPLEKLVRYFLRTGGVAENVDEINELQKWQVDGQGRLHKKHILLIWGESTCKKIGFQLYMEAKNHTDPMTNQEFALHCQRMTSHECYIGVVASTSGYMIAHGKGIAELIHLDYCRGIFHLLLTFHAFCEVLRDNKAPLTILTEALDYAVNNKYVNSKVIQEKYTQASCRELAESEYRRLCGKE